MLTWLQLSDLHFRESTRWDSDRLLKALIEDIGQRVEKDDLRPDLIFITGDIAFSAQPAEYELAGHFLDKVRKVCQLGQDRIFTVPGNHDVDRKLFSRAAKSTISDLRARADGAGIADVFQNPAEKPTRDVLFAPLTAYNSFVPSACKITADRVYWTARLQIEGCPKQVALLGLNSAWTATGESDQGKLILGRYQVEKALAQIQEKEDLVLALIHHPLSWTIEWDSRDAGTLLYRADLVLRGHLHSAEEMIVPRGAVCVASGCVYDGGRYPNSYSFGRVDQDRGLLSLFIRRWFFDRGGIWAWDPVIGGDKSPGRDSYPLPRLCPQEVQTSVERAGAGASGDTPPIDLTDWLTTLLQQTDHIQISGIGSGVGKVKAAGRHPIEQLYTTLRSRADSGGPGKGESARDGGTVKLSELLPRRRLLLIEGQPGSGKTTFLRYVASMLARDTLGKPCPDGTTWSSKYLGLQTATPRRIPVFLRLSGLVSVLDKDRATGKDDRERLLELLIEETVHAENPTAWKNHWRERLVKGEAMLLLDGLDEVADEKLRERVFNIFRNACEGWSKCPIVVTSRPIQTLVLRQMDFHAVTIEPFGDGEIREFLGRWVNALFGIDEQARPHEGSAEYRGRLEKSIVEQPSIRRMARNPVMLTCLCVVHWNEGGLPNGRARVYKAVIRWLIASRTELRKKAEFTDGFALRAFALLALRMMGSGENDRKKAVFELQQAAEVLEPLIRVEFPSIRRSEDRREKAHQWVRFECLGSGIIEEISVNQFRFWHLTFEEYLAAFQLAWLGDGTEADKDWWPAVSRHLDDVQWRETIELVPGCLFDQGGPRRVDLLLERVLGLREGSLTLPSDARIAGIVGRLVSTLDAYDHRPPPSISGLCETIRDRSLEIFTPEGSRQVPVEMRIDAAEALGRGGDHRLAHSRENMIPVPGLDGLSLGKYPVTVEEYRRFIDNGGYDEFRYWDDEGWSWRNSQAGRGLPDEWEDQSQAPNRPVVGVSWYEARAYCRWLSEQWKETIRLPTSEEWEKSATPEEGRYPWGSREEPTPELANYGSNVKHPTPVGVYPSGNGPYGHCDLAGNVWEWCEDPPPEVPDARVVRGGAWNVKGDSLRCAYRSDHRPANRYDNVGFRCVSSLPRAFRTDVRPLPIPDLFQEKTEPSSCTSGILPEAEQGSKPSRPCGRNPNGGGPFQGEGQRSRGHPKVAGGRRRRSDDAPSTRPRPGSRRRDN